MCETINWLTPTKEVVKERVIEKDAAAEARKKKVEEKLAQKEAEKKIEEVKQKILEDLLKKAVQPAAIKFDSIKHLGQERVDEEERKQREYHEEGERRKAKAIAEEQVSANKLVNSDELKQVIEKNVGKWITELSIRAISITKECIIEFDEFQDFYVSKFFDEHDDCFNCDVKIKFYDTKLNNVCYEKLYENQWLYVDPIDELSANGDEKLTRTARMESRKRESW